jgi:hypothetical protein
MRAQRQPRLVHTLLGAASLVAALALMSPGVRIARAEDGAAAPAAATVDPKLVEAQPVVAPPETRAAPACAAASPGALLRDGAFQAQQLQIQQEIARRASGNVPAAPHSSNDGIVLNGRGYNYGPPAGGQPGL